MNPCDHPHLFYSHGQFLSHEQGPGPQEVPIPQISYCSTMLHQDIRFPVPYLWVEDTNDPEFDEKSDERLLWRGTTTGMFHSSKSRWRHSHRDFLVASVNEINGTANVLDPAKGEDEKVGELQELKRAHLNPALFDIAFTGRPHSCSASTCDTLEKLYVWKGFQGYDEAGEYKYVFDVGVFLRLKKPTELLYI